MPGADAVASAGDHRDPSIEKPVPVVDAWDAVWRGRRSVVTRHSDGPYAAVRENRFQA